MTSSCRGDRTGDHGNGGVTHDDFLCVGVSAASGRGTFSRSTSRTSLSVMVMLRNRLPVRVNRCGSSVMKNGCAPCARPAGGPALVGEAALDHLGRGRRGIHDMDFRPDDLTDGGGEHGIVRAAEHKAVGRGETSQTAAQGSVKPRLRRWGRRTSLLRPAARTGGRRGCGPALRGGGGGWLRHRPRCGWWIRWR